ncbi:hypothetical protein AB0P21_20975 [Kribbella sp. NPDC056861]|uniref:hypothetical protein n=1 Tax=Kribbella sp. NPDC056861 TaxID=3154857 RepID=UPI003422E407
MADMPPPEAVTLSSLEELLVRFEAGLIGGEDVLPTIRGMVAVAGQSADPARWRDALADELRSYLSDLWPDDDTEPPPMTKPCLDAVCEFVLAMPCPELAWVLLVRMDPDSIGPEQVIADMSALLALGDGVDAEVRAEALIARADAERERGNASAGIEDRVEAYSLTEDPQLRIGCALDLVVALGESDEVLGTAEWAWRAGLLLEEHEPDGDPELWWEVILALATAADHLHAIDGPIEQIRLLMDRILSRPNWWPDDVSGTDLEVLAASAANQDNDLPGALDHLGKARLYWDGASESVQAEWHLTRGETGVLAGDLIAVESAARSAEPWIRQAGDEEQRRRFETLIRWATGVTGDPEHGLADDPVKVVNEMVLRMRTGVIDAGELELLDRTIAECDRVTQGHLIVGMNAMRAMVFGGLKRLDEAQQALAEAYEAFQWLQEAKPGGYPQALVANLEMSAALVEFASGRPVESVQIIEASWRGSRAAGSLAATTVAATAAAFLLLKVLRRPQAAIEAAVVAVTASQELRFARVDSGDRLAFAGMHAEAHQWAIEAAEELQDPYLMAELLEVLRAQAMPHVSAGRETAGGPLGSLLGAMLVADESRDGASAKAPDAAGTQSPGVELSPPPLILMPWGAVALARWLSYPPDVHRYSGRLDLGPVC